MIDIHTHILPGIDDGAKSLAESLEILRELVKQGVSDVIATPHIITGTYDNTKEIITNKIELLRDEIKSNGIPIKIYSGSELYIEPNIIENIKKNNLTLANSKYILFETALQRFPNNYEDVIWDFLNEGYKPIIAHAERFMPFINYPNRLIRILNRGVYLQINAGSLFGFHGEQIKEFVHWLLERGCVHFVASDSHGINNRPIPMSRAYEYLAETFNKNLADLLMQENPNSVIHDQPLENLITGSYWEEEKPRPSFGRRLINFLSRI